jgi:hypothetical protein
LDQEIRILEFRPEFRHLEGCGNWARNSARIPRAAPEFYPQRSWFPTSYAPKLPGNEAYCFVLVLARALPSHPLVLRLPPQRSPPVAGAGARSRLLRTAAVASRGPCHSADVDPWWPPPSDRSNPTSAAPAWPFSGMMRSTDYFDLSFDWAIDEPHCALEWNLERQIDPFVCIQEKNRIWLFTCCTTASSARYFF